MTEWQKAYNAGEAAYDAGEPISACPAELQTELAEEWASGWLQREEWVAREDGRLTD
jgi:hypothetical protein